MTPPDSKTVARLTSPAQLVAAVPAQLGYQPTESIVIQCCHEPRGRVGLSIRADLPPPSLERPFAAQLAGHVRDQAATRVVVLVYTDEPDHPDGRRARQSLAEALEDELEGIVITELTLVRAGRFWSYICTGKPCCPPEGTPVEEAADDPMVRLLETERIFEGKAILPSRQALAQTLEGPTFLHAEAARQRCADAAAELRRAAGKRGSPAASILVLREWDAACLVADEGVLPDDRGAARLAMSLDDIDIRDAVAGLSPDDAPGLLALLGDLCRRTPDELAAPVCAVFAWASYCRGAGTEVTIAVERALRCDPDYSMARLMLAALEHQVDPELLRTASRSARLTLRRAS